MKKYFMKGTDDEVQFGDMIILDLSGEDKEGKTHRHLECKFCEALVDLLMEKDVIEVRDDKAVKPATNETKEEEHACSLEERVKKLEEFTESLEERIDYLESSLEEVRQVALILSKRCLKDIVSEITAA